jgi:hypothetical protein
MVNGVLTISMKPAYVHFQSNGDESDYLKYCTAADIQYFLNNLMGQSYPMKDCIVRLVSNFSYSDLNALNFARKVK